MGWAQGGDTIERMIAGRQLERVTADRELAQRILDQAVTHLATAEREADLDPVMAYSAVYDAARKALTAVLQVQGLRATRLGGHIAVLHACLAQLDPPLGKVLRPLDRIRRIRHAGEYPDPGTVIVPDDVRADLGKASEIVDVAGRLIDKLPVYTTAR